MYTGKHSQAQRLEKSLKIADGNVFFSAKSVAYWILKSFFDRKPFFGIFLKN